MKSDILQEILLHKRNEITVAKQQYSVEALKEFAQEQDQPRGFLRTLRQAAQRKQMAVIAEVKRASPSKGVLRKDFDALAIARSYMLAGASCLSVLTDGKYFKGSGVVLDLIRKHCPLPALRKDFIIDPYQVYESRAFGADCILLIAAAMPITQLEELLCLAVEQGMDVLVEVHDEAELEQVLGIGDAVKMIGINNRDLKTFTVDIQTTVLLAKQVRSDQLVVSESGITEPADIALMRDAGVYACLIGESLIVANDPGEKLKMLLSAGGKETWQTN